jgi:YfiH family protein
VTKGFKLKDENGITYLQLPVFRRIRHAFCTRTVGEEVSLTALGIPPGRLLTLRQVHGAEVLIFEENTKAALTYSLPYDAVITDKKRVALGIWTADCLPILMVDRSQRIIAAVHAGWRGIWRGVIERTVNAMMKTFESSPADIVAGIGPGIGPCCYEVQQDVVSLFRNSHGSPDQLIQEREGRSYLDLSRAAQLELSKAGIPPDNIEAIPLCTCCREDLFFSFRRDKRPRRQLSFIMLR